MTAGSGILVARSIAHERASVDAIAAVDIEGQGAAAAALLDRDGVEEAFVLGTCNRVEGYVVAEDATAGRRALATALDGAPADAVRELGHQESLRHLLAVAAGLESVVVGEDQILGQVSDAYEAARAVGAIGPFLETAVTKAIRVGERARTETAINEGVVSMASAAVRLADREVDLEGSTGLVVGAGEMGTLAAEALAEVVDRLYVANRTVSQAAHVAASVPVEADATALDSLPAALDSADVVVTATGATDPVVDRDALAVAGETFVVDLGQPRDVPVGVGDLEGVSVRDLDALESLTEETRRRRETAAGAVAEIVDEEFERLMRQFKRQRADQVISAMYESADGVKDREVQTALAKLDLDQEGEAVVEAMADAIVSQLLAPPTKSLRDAAEADDWETIHTALTLFDPDFGPAEPPAGAESPAIPPELREAMPQAVLEQLTED